MRIGIDGYNLTLPNGTGVATYGVALAGTIAAMGHEIDGIFGLDVGSRPDVREVLFYDQLQRPAPLKKPRKRWHTYVAEVMRPVTTIPLLDVPVTDLVEKSAFADRMPPFTRLASAAHLFERAHAHFAAFGRFAQVRMDHPPDIMHWTYPVPITMLGTRNVYTLHDMVPLRLPYTTLDVKADYHRLVEQCIHRADHICTVSDASRDDILSRFTIDPARLTNTYQIAPMPPETNNPIVLDAQSVEGLFGLKYQGYFLYFGAIEPKKNLGRLIEAYLTAQLDTPLVIVGGRAWDSDQELKLLGGGGDTVYGRRLADRIIKLDYLPRRLLLRLVRCARAVAFPSLFEGFGLPVHEAMLLGTPVLSSTTSSIPEVAGDAALLVDPYQVSAIAEGLIRLDQDEELRLDLGRRGKIHARTFSVERYQARLAQMYEGVLTAPARH